MNYYAIQVKTKSEGKYLKLAEYMLDVNCGAAEDRPTFIWPRRKLTIRKQGRTREQLSPIFPGYLFLETEKIPPKVYWTLRKVTGFFRFLKDNRKIEPLGGIDRELLLHFISHGEVVEKSTVYFDENQKIRVIQGPMKGLEGRIVKVDKRKQRAKIRLDLYDDTFSIDFGFDLLEGAEEKK
jgi:transcription termination/antitermination protein NusG